MTDDKPKDEVANPAGMPEMNPPEGGPNADPDAPDPSNFMRMRPGPSEEAEDAEVESGTE